MVDIHKVCEFLLANIYCKFYIGNHTPGIQQYHFTPLQNPQCHQPANEALNLHTGINQSPLTCAIARTTLSHYRDSV